jgi:hypothetical protein
MAPTGFTIFPLLPPELRNKIWYHAANQEPRSLDLWTDFKHCEIDNTIFYVQRYDCELSARPPPPIFRAASESRREALKYYALEYSTGMTLPNGTSVTIAPKFYINYASDTIIPRGFWNIISFSNFALRVAGSLKFLAIDVNGSFWTENMRDYCKKAVWLFGELEELILYDSSADEMFKESGFLEKFRQKYRDGPKDLGFEECEQPTKQMSDVKGFLEKMFDRIEGKVVEIVLGEDGLPVQVVEEKLPSYLKGYESTSADELQRPVLRLAKLEVTHSSPCVGTESWVRRCMVYGSFNPLPWSCIEVLGGGLLFICMD